MTNHRLYHGTSAKHLDAILDRGIEPRGKRKSLWKDHPSLASNVYMTTAYSLHFAKHAAAHTRHEDGLILELDATCLPPWDMLPDEDAIAQSMLRQDPNWCSGDIGRATRRARQALTEFVEQGADWEWSMRVLGNCSHMGTVPPHAIKRAVRLHNVTGIEWMIFGDPSIHIMNYLFLGSYYRACSDWLIGGAQGYLPRMSEETIKQMDGGERIMEEWRNAVSRASSMVEVVYERKGA